jgi:hypothetical protein
LLSHDGDGDVPGSGRAGDYLCHAYVPVPRPDDGGDDGGVHVRHGRVYGCDAPLRGGRIREQMGWPVPADEVRLVLVEVFVSRLLVLSRCLRYQVGQLDQCLAYVAIYHMESVHPCTK